MARSMSETGCKETQNYSEVSLSLYYCCNEKHIYSCYANSIELATSRYLYKGSARLSAYKLKQSNHWHNLNPLGHTRITNIISNPILEMGCDYMFGRLSFDKPFNTKLEWSQNKNHCLEGSLIWYIDGSKTDSGSGAGIHGRAPRCDIYVPLGCYKTLFQA